MSLIKLANELDNVRPQFEDTNLFDKTLSSVAIGAPGSAAYGALKGTTAHAINPARWNKKKAKIMAARSLLVGTGITAATSPVRNMVADVYQGVGEELLKDQYDKVKTQEDYDKFRERTTTLGAGATVGLGTSLFAGAPMGAVAGGLAAKGTYINEKIESKIRQNRVKLMDKFKGGGNQND